MQFGEHYFECRHLSLRVFPNGDTAAIVGDLDRAIAMKRDEDLVGFAGCSLVVNQRLEESADAY